MKILATFGRVFTIFSLLFLTLIVGGVCASSLSLPPPQDRFLAPEQKVVMAALLFLVSLALSIWRWPRPIDLLLAWVAAQMLIALIVFYCASFLYWLMYISLFTTLMIGLGMILGLMVRRKRNSNKTS